MGAEEDAAAASAAPAAADFWAQQRQQAARFVATAATAQGGRVELTLEELYGATRCELVLGALPGELADTLLLQLLADRPHFARGQWHFKPNQPALAGHLSCHYSLLPGQVRSRGAAPCPPPPPSAAAVPARQRRTPA